MFRRLTSFVPKPVLRFFQDCRGVAAIEFAFVAPVLIVAYIGMAELTVGMMAARKTAHLGATLGDLASQSDNLTLTNISDLWSIGGSMLQPFDTSVGLKMRLSEVMMNTSNNAVVQWSQPSNWTAYTPKVTVLPQITTTQLAQNQYMIVSEVEYDYVSPFGQFLPGTKAFTYTYYYHPRNGTQVTQIGS